MFSQFCTYLITNWYPKILRRAPASSPYLHSTAPMDLEHLFLRYCPVGIVSVAKGGKGWAQPCVEFCFFPALPAQLPFAPITASSLPSFDRRGDSHPETLGHKL